MNKWLDPLGYNEKLNRPLPTGINKKVIGILKDELDGMVMTEFCAPRAKTYAFKYDDNDKTKEKKKVKGTKKCVIKNDLKFEDYKDSVLKTKSYLDHNNDLKAIIIMYLQKN